MDRIEFLERLARVKILFVSLSAIPAECVRGRKDVSPYAMFLSLCAYRDVNFVRGRGVAPYLSFRDSHFKTVGWCRAAGVDYAACDTNAWERRRRFERFLRWNRCGYDDVLCLASEMEDCDMVQRAGLSACPSSAHSDIRGLADFVSEVHGRSGFVSDICRMFA